MCRKGIKGALFLSTLSLRRATCEIMPESTTCRFLSTLSLRRATVDRDTVNCWESDFYPRSPCGERQYNDPQKYQVFFISIHALLAESDQSKCSTLINTIWISIHALLAESDAIFCAERFCRFKFLSTLSLRRATS